MLVLEAGPGEAADRQRRKARSNGRRRRLAAIAAFMLALRFPAIVMVFRPTDQIGLSEPCLPFGNYDAGAGAALHELPRIALEIDGRGALAGRAGPGGAIVLALQRDAEALLLVGGRWRRRPRPWSAGRPRRHGRERGRDGAGKDQRTDNILQTLISPLTGWHRLLGEGASSRSFRHAAAVTGFELLT